MIQVTIELLPGGDEEAAQPIGVIMMANDAKRSTASKGKYGDYNVVASHAGKYFGVRKEPYKKGKVVNFKRTDSPYKLLAMALAAMGIDV